jgi:hypothetical protein
MIGSYLTFVSFRHSRHLDLSNVLEAERWLEVELVESLLDLLL